MTSMKFSFGLVAVLCLVGCEQEQSKPAEVSKPIAAAPVKPAAAPVVKATPVSLESIPTEEDFEEEAAKEITLANVGQQIERLEKELQSE